MGQKRTDEFRQDTVWITLTSGGNVKQSQKGSSRAKSLEVYVHLPPGSQNAVR